MRNLNWLPSWNTWNQAPYLVKWIFELYIKCFYLNKNVFISHVFSTSLLLSLLILFNPLWILPFSSLSSIYSIVYLIFSSKKNHFYWLFCILNHFEMFRIHLWQKIYIHNCTIMSQFIVRYNILHLHSILHLCIMLQLSPIMYNYNNYHRYVTWCLWLTYSRYYADCDVDRTMLLYIALKDNQIFFEKMQYLYFIQLKMNSLESGKHIFCSYYEFWNV